MNNLHNKTTKLESNIIDLKIKETTEIKLEKERLQKKVEEQAKILKEQQNQIEKLKINTNSTKTSAEVNQQKESNTKEKVLEVPVVIEVFKPQI